MCLCIYPYIRLFWVPHLPSVSPNIHQYSQEKGEQKTTKVTAPKLSLGSYQPPLTFVERETDGASHSSRVTEAIQEKECHQINPHRSMQKHRDTAFAKTGFLSPNGAPSPLLATGSDSWSYLLSVYTTQENQCHQQTKAFSDQPFIHNGWRVPVRETDDGKGISSTQVRTFFLTSARHSVVDSRGLQVTMTYTVTPGPKLKNVALNGQVFHAVSHRQWGRGSWKGTVNGFPLFSIVP